MARKRSVEAVPAGEGDFVTVKSIVTSVSQPTDPLSQSDPRLSDSMSSARLSSSPPQAENLREDNDMEAPGMFTVTAGTAICG